MICDNSGPCNTVNHLGHSKMSVDDDDDEQLLSPDAYCDLQNTTFDFRPGASIQTPREAYSAPQTP